MYDQYYGLSGRPFQLTPDPQFYFESATHRKALSYLGYGLAQGEGFIVITGEVGSGKSTLVSHLMQTIDRSRLSAATIVTSQLDGHDLVQMVAESFGIQSSKLDKAATLKAIEEHLHAEARAGRRALLIVDEAQNLSVDAVEELRMLSNFQLGSQALLQIFLLGQPEFRDLVQNSAELEQLRQRIIATHHLEAMEADEVEPYILHRLAQVGWEGRPRIESDAIGAVFAETEGVPRKINTLMNRVLLMGSVEQVDVIDAALVEAVVADMAGRPFEYTAPKAAVAEAPVAEAPAEDNVPEMAEAVETPAPAPEAEEQPAAEQAIEIPLAVSSDMVAAEDVAEPEKVAADQAEASEEPAQMQEALPAGEEGRIAALEARIAEQEAALRRVLTMMIDWMDKEEAALDLRINEARAA